MKKFLVAIGFILSFVALAHADFTMPGERARPRIKISATAPTKQSFTTGTSATYTTPANVKWIQVRIVGPGAGGSGSGTAGGGTAGSPGVATTFGTMTANPGQSTTSSVSSLGGAGGTASGGDINVQGAQGGALMLTVGTVSGGASGGVGPWGGSGGGGYNNTAGAAATGYGAGGGGAGGSTTVYGGTGGGAGGYSEKIIAAPSATYTYTVGQAGTAGAAGTSGVAGGVGFGGFIIVEEHYNY